MAAASREAPAARTGAAVQAELDLAREAAAARGHDLAAAREAYSRAVDVGQEAALAARRALTEAEVGHEVAARAVQRLEAELEQLARAEAEALAAAERARIIGAAEGAVARYRDAFAAEYPRIIEVARALIRLEAEAALACAEAARAGIMVEGPDDFRTLPARPREVLATEVRQLWLNPYGGNAPFSDDAQKRIKVQHDGCGVLPPQEIAGLAENGVRAEDGNNRKMRPSIEATRRQPFEFVTYVPGRAERRAVRLADGICLPPVLAGELAGWEPSKDAEASKVLQALSFREAEGDAGPAEDLSPKTDRRALGPPVDVTRRPTVTGSGHR